MGLLHRIDNFFHKLTIISKMINNDDRYSWSQEEKKRKPSEEINGLDNLGFKQETGL